MSVDFYSNFKLACEEQGTTITAVLKELGRSTGSTGSWQSGTFPRLDLCMEIAERLGVPLDYLVYRNGRESHIPDMPRDEIALELFQSLPETSQLQALDYLKALQSVSKERKAN